MSLRIPANQCLRLTSSRVTAAVCTSTTTTSPSSSGIRTIHTTPALSASLAQQSNKAALKKAALSAPSSASSVPVRIHATTQPPSTKAPTSRKTYLHRIYLSLLRSSPLTIIFQHNALKAAEWAAIRRELVSALAAVDATLPDKKPLANNIKITVGHVGILGPAIRVADSAPKAKEGGLGFWSHGPAQEASLAAKRLKPKHALTPLLTGPLGMVTFPVLSPKHILAVMDMMFPTKRMPAKKSFDPAATAGLIKLLFLGARVQERPLGMSTAMEDEGVRWLAGLKSVEEMRGELVAMLQSVGGGEVVRSLESMAISLGRTVEGRRVMLEEAAGGPKTPEGGAEAPVA